MAHCTRCGRFVDEDDGGVVNEEQGYAYCPRCEADYQKSLAEEYPYGQCQECGAPYFLHTFKDGHQVYRAWHAEGLCPYWSDWVEEESYCDELEAEADDACVSRHLEEQGGF
jgi:DNA-directed RNA polymerase subunit RPC12/RpoP